MKEIYKLAFAEMLTIAIPQLRISRDVFKKIIAKGVVVYLTDGVRYDYYCHSPSIVIIDSIKYNIPMKMRNVIARLFVDTYSRR